jgi:hypothetical protein
MSGGQWMVVLIVAIVACASFLKASVIHGTKVAETEAANAPDKEKLLAELRALKERVAVLERIATDNSTMLGQEIEALRDRS